MKQNNLLHKRVITDQGIDLTTDLLKDDATLRSHPFQRDHDVLSFLTLIVLLTPTYEDANYCNAVLMS